MDRSSRRICNFFSQTPCISCGQIGIERQPTSVTCCLCKCLYPFVRCPDLSCHRGNGLKRGLMEGNVFQPQILSQIIFIIHIPSPQDHMVTGPRKQSHAVLKAGPGTGGHQ